VTRLKSEWVFCNAIGGPLDRDNLTNRVWYPAVKRAGLRERKPYQTRHSFATLALSAGEAVGWVAKQMGHSNTKMIIEPAKETPSRLQPLRARLASRRSPRAHGTLACAPWSHLFCRLTSTCHS
jgi:integrase